MRALFISLFILVVLAYPESIYAATPFTVTSFFNDHEFTWVNGPPDGCSAVNSYVMTFPSNNQQANLNACNETYGSASDPIPDGQYYIFLAVGGQPWKSQTFTINNGRFEQPALTPAPPITPTPSITNHPPVAIAGTSLDQNGNLQLDASNSFDTDDDPLTYFWRFSHQKGLIEGKTVSLTHLESADYEVQLFVSDDTSQSTDVLKVGIPYTKPQESIDLHIEKLSLDKKNGNFTIKGNIDKEDKQFEEIVDTPFVRLTLELQTKSKKNEVIFGALGLESVHLDSKWKFND